MEMQLLLEDFRLKEVQLEKVTAVLATEVRKVPHAEKLLSIKGVGSSQWQVFCRRWVTYDASTHQSRSGSWPDWN